MRFRPRYRLTTLLLLPVLVGVGIKLYRGPHEYSLLEEHQKWAAEWTAQDPSRRYTIHRVRTGTFWAYRNFDGSLTRHGPEISFGKMGDKKLVEYRNGKQHGKYQTWYIDGELSCEGQCENDEPTGEWIHYSNGLAYRRERYDRDAGRQTQEIFDLEQLTERRVTTLATNEVQITAWHANGKKRLDGRLVQDRPDGKWCWWDARGNEVRKATFRAGVPDELADHARIVRFMEQALEFEFQDVPLHVALDYIRERGIRVRVEDSQPDAKRIGTPSLTTVDDVRGPLALYLALRDVGLTMDVRTDVDQVETLVIHRID